MNGFFLIDKPKGWTSRDVCNKISHLTNERKVGHAGTLDPFATGLLVVALGKATKASRFIRDENKSYIASLVLGRKSSTGDETGVLSDVEKIPTFSIEKINDVLNSFLGKSEQIPPMTSAIHINGKKLYEYAHEGKIIDRTPRKIEIFKISLINYVDNVITFSVTVSSGTYIRTLGEDIATKLGTVGYLNDLRRINFGNLSIVNAIQINDVINVIPKTIEEILTNYYQTIILSDDDVVKAMNGLVFIFKNKDDLVLLLNKNNEAIAVYSRIEGDRYSSLRGLW